MVTRSNERYASRLKELCADKKMKLARLSREIGVGQSTLNQIANGKRAASPAIIVALCDYLGCEAGDLAHVLPAPK